MVKHLHSASKQRRRRRRRQLNANGKKAIGLDLQNNNPLPRFFAFLTVATQPQRENT